MSNEDIQDKRLDDHEEDIKEIKIDVKDINKSIIRIEKTDIRIEIDVKSILDTYKIIRNAGITFVVLNVLMMLWTLSNKLM